MIDTNGPKDIKKECQELLNNPQTTNARWMCMSCDAMKITETATPKYVILIGDKTAEAFGVWCFDCVQPMTRFVTDEEFSREKKNERH